MFAEFFKGDRRSAVVKAAVLIAAIALLDWRVIGQVPLGFLYLLPMFLLGAALTPWQIACAAALCTLLAEIFDDLAWTPRTGLPRDVLYFAAFLGAGLFVREVSRSRSAALEHLHEIEQQRDARVEAEEQLRVLIESSPAAVFTADDHGVVLMANEAAHRMLGLPQSVLIGRSVHRYLPSLRNVFRPDAQYFRSVMQARGQREDGETFLADICFSTYRTNAGSRLAAMVLDASEDFRSNEVSGLHQLLLGSRIAIGAISHEVRNLSGAIGAIHQNLSVSGLLAGNKDFEALGNLVLTLQRIASVNLRQTSEHATEVDLAALLDELKIVVAPQLQEEDIAATWQIEPGLPPVWADRPSLMQVFLNLITNSVRVLARRDERTLSIAARNSGGKVLVEIADNGGGVPHPEYLFRPFQAGPGTTGLGLYLSRAFMRSFGGELNYMPVAGGACFVASMNPVWMVEQE